MRLTRALTTNIKLALRNLVRDRTYGLISVIGLSVAMACAILVLSRAIEAYRHVEYYTHGDRTYRVLKRSVGDSGVSIGDWVSGGSTVALRDFPEVELAARASASLFTRQWVRAGDITYKQFFCRADPELIELLELAFVRGHLSTDPLTAVVTEDVGRKFFGDVDPVGQTLSLLDSGEAADYRITGLLRNLPEYAHIKIHVMTAAPPSSAVQEDFEIWEGWSGSLWGQKNYVRLAERTDPAAIEERLNEVMGRSIPSEAAERLSLYLQPMSRAYLYGESDLGDSGGNPMDHLQLLAFITLVVIAVASANFVNLTAARTVVRTREVAARRAVGASRFDIFLQFLVESMVVSTLALVVGVVGDFHHRSFQYAVEPMVLLNWSRIALGVRVRPENLPETIASMKKTFARFFDQPADFAFVEDWYGRKYSRERRQGQSYAILAWTAVFLAGLGVFGLAAFETEQRRREVGVRKVLGASVGSIVTLFWKRDVRLVLAANLVAWPAGYWLMNDWLSQFAYRIDLSLTPFALAGSATGALFLAVVGSLAMRIGRVDPAETLRSE